MFAQSIHLWRDITVSDRIHVSFNVPWMVSATMLPRHAKRSVDALSVSPEHLCGGNEITLRFNKNEM